jgi:hypothetical protein
MKRTRFVFLYLPEETLKRRGAWTRDGCFAGVRVKQLRLEEDGMKKKINVWMVAAAVVVVLITLPSFAQSRRAGFKVSVPFQFFVAETLLPPGEYIIQRIGGHGDAFVFRTADLHPFQMQLVSAREMAGRSSRPNSCFTVTAVSTTSRKSGQRERTVPPNAQRGSGKSN